MSDQHQNDNTVPVAVSRRGLRRHLTPHKRVLMIISALGIVSAVANGFMPYLTGRFFDSLIAIAQDTAPVGTMAPWLFFLSLWAAVQFIANNVDWFVDRLARRLDIALHMGVQVRGFIHLFQLPLSFHKDAHINEVLEILSRAGWRIEALAHSIIRIAPQLVSIVVGLVLALSINVILASMLLFGVLVYTLLLLWILKPVAHYDKRAHQHWNEAWNSAAEAATQIESVKQAAAEAYEESRVHSAFYDHAAKDWRQLENLYSNVDYFQRLAILATQLAIFIVSVSFISDGILSVGELVALNGYALMFFGPIVEFGRGWKNVQNGLTAAGQAERIFEIDGERYHPDHAIVPDTYRGALRFDHVSYRYDRDERLILDDVSFDIKPGETVALVGRSGVGKSTAVALVSGYYFPSKGSVLIDGVDTRALDLTDLRRHIAVVPQEVALFNETIATNIRYGSFDADMERVIEASKEALLHDFIQELPQGYETLVGERGVKLSVGQKQRIAIARAILRDPAILILDEPTSALDAETEAGITESLGRLMRGRTTLIIAHRLSTVREADRILVFKQGHVVEEGTHTELMHLKGEYHRFYSLQSHGTKH